MKKPKDKIEDLFQSHINDFDKMPDDSLWDTIEANLPPVATPVHRLWRWGLAAALLLFSLIGYMAYQSLNTWQKADVIGAKGSTSKSNTTAQKSISKKDAKTASEANESNLTEEYQAKETKAANEAKNDKTAIAENQNQKDKHANSSELTKSQKNRTLINQNPVTKSAELITEKESLAYIGKNQITAVEENNNQQRIITAEEITKGLSAIDYLSNRNNITANAIPLNTHIAYEADYQPQEKKESFFKAPSEVYVSLTPSLNYYRVFANSPINQFNGANNGGRVGWAVQAGAVYPLKFKRMSYRVGLSYFSTQSSFKYNRINRTQMPIRLNNNTFEYVNVESTQAESKKWQVLEIQNDLMYRVRPMQDFIMGFKTGSSFTEKPVFDAYAGYRFSKQVSNRQILWIEAGYAYAINAQKSNNNTFSYHMDKYSLRIGLNFK
jgi:hypothetical protein